MKKLVIGLCVIGAALIAAAFWMKPASRNERVRYTEAPLAFGDLAEVVSTSGPLSPQKVTLVSSLVPGQVVKIFPNADFNRYVEEGEPLLQLDDGFVRAKRDQAIAAVTAAKADLASARSAEKSSTKKHTSWKRNATNRRWVRNRHF
ncbi:MAG: hypothetical protein KatS3mg105_0101 [Gemmatales bacterium]|nr:MAG: hypothetical protein KatS3mg105_0101 [Gemmatales bacterium]